MENEAVGLSKISLRKLDGRMLYKLVIRIESPRKKMG
jgi:hypothetical protein